MKLWEARVSYTYDLSNHRSQKNLTAEVPVFVHKEGSPEEIATAALQYVTNQAKINSKRKCHLAHNIRNISVLEVKPYESPFFSPFP